MEEITRAWALVQRVTQATTWAKLSDQIPRPTSGNGVPG
jgi:hypothetical protein